METSFLIAGPRVRGTFVIFACITLVSESGLSVTVAFRKAIPNSTSLILPMMLPLARAGPPGHAWVLHLDIWEESPGQGRPRFNGAGLLHRRTRVCSPPPQEAEHWLHDCHCPQFPSTGHRSVLHLWICTSAPAQALPPLAGRGLSQLRYRLVWPPLHVRLQVPQLLHGPQLP